MSTKTIENNNIELLKYYAIHFSALLDKKHPDRLKCPLASCVDEPIIHMPVSMFNKLCDMADADYIDNLNKLKVFEFVTSYHAGTSGIRPEVYDRIYAKAKQEAKERRDLDADTSDEEV